MNHQNGNGGSRATKTCTKTGCNCEAPDRPLCKKHYDHDERSRHGAHSATSSASIKQQVNGESKPKVKRTRPPYAKVSVPGTAQRTPAPLDTRTPRTHAPLPPKTPSVTAQKIPTLSDTHSSPPTGAPQSTKSARSVLSTAQRTPALLGSYSSDSPALLPPKPAPRQPLASEETGVEATGQTRPLSQSSSSRHIRRGIAERNASRSAVKQPAQDLLGHMKPTSSKQNPNKPVVRTLVNKHIANSANSANSHKTNRALSNASEPTIDNSFSDSGHNHVFMRDFMPGGKGLDAVAGKAPSKINHVDYTSREASRASALTTNSVFTESHLARVNSLNIPHPLRDTRTTSGGTTAGGTASRCSAPQGSICAAPPALHSNALLTASIEASRSATPQTIPMLSHEAALIASTETNLSTVSKKTFSKAVVPKSVISLSSETFPGSSFVAKPSTYVTDSTSNATSESNIDVIRNRNGKRNASSDLSITRADPEECARKVSATEKGVGQAHYTRDGKPSENNSTVCGTAVVPHIGAHAPSEHDSIISLPKLGVEKVPTTAGCTNAGVSHRDSTTFDALINQPSPPLAGIEVSQQCISVRRSTPTLTRSLSKHEFILPELEMGQEPTQPVHTKRKQYDSTTFDAMIYSQAGAQALPEGDSARLKKSKTGEESVDERVYLHINPFIHGMHQRSDEWYERKAEEIKKRGGRKIWFGKPGARERAMRALEAQAPQRKDPKPWSHQRPIDYGDIPQDKLPSHVTENQNWMHARAQLVENRKHVWKETVAARKQEARRDELAKSEEARQREEEKRALREAFSQQAAAEVQQQLELLQRSTEPRHRSRT